MPESSVSTGKEKPPDYRMGQVAKAILRMFDDRDYLYVAAVKRELPDTPEKKIRNAFSSLRHRGVIRKTNGGHRSAARGPAQSIYELCNRKKSIRPVPDSPFTLFTDENPILNPVAGYRSRKIALLRRLVDKTPLGPDRDLLLGIITDYQA